MVVQGVSIPPNFCCIASSPTGSYCLLLSPTVSCSCSDALYTLRNTYFRHLLPSPNVYDPSTTRLSLLPNHHPKAMRRKWSESVASEPDADSVVEGELGTPTTPTTPGTPTSWGGGSTVGVSRIASLNDVSEEEGDEEGEKGDPKVNPNQAQKVKSVMCALCSVSLDIVVVVDLY